MSMSNEDYGFEEEGEYYYDEEDYGSGEPSPDQMVG